MRLFETLVLITGVLSVFSGCAFDDGGQCVVDDECASGACVAGQCQPAISDLDADAGTQDLSKSERSDDVSMSDIGIVDSDDIADAGGVRDLSNTSDDMNDSEPDSWQPSSCASDAFGGASCTNDEFESNDRFPHNLPPTSGCVSGDDVVTKSETLEAVLCPGDVDLFSFVYVECDTRNLQIRVRATPGVECRHDEWSLRLQQADCSDPAVRCSDEPDGAKEIRMLVPAPSRTEVLGLWMRVAAEGDTRFPYTLEIEVQ